MSALRFSLATAADDAQLRQRMAADWMQGRITVSFRREPSFFAGCRLQGERVETVICTETGTEKIVGLGSRASGLAYVNGTPVRIGYLADLRCAPTHRRGTVLARGFKFLRGLHESDPLPLYTTVIYEGNEPALSALLGARAGLPAYRGEGRLLTPAIRLNWDLAALRVPGIEVVRGSAETLPQLMRFVNTQLATRQFAPVYRADDLTEGRLSGLAPGDFLLAIAHGRIVGTIALWDQSAIRQTHVERYPGLLGGIRPVYNLYAALAHRHGLPRPGSRIPYVYFACFAVENDDLTLGGVLLRAAYRAARHGPWYYAIAGLHERDPLSQLFGDYLRIEAAGRLFLVQYPGEGVLAERLDDRVPYLEAGCL